MGGTHTETITNSVCDKVLELVEREFEKSNFHSDEEIIKRLKESAERDKKELQSCEQTNKNNEIAKVINKLNETSERLKENSCTCIKTQEK